ncbi:MAG: ferritin [Candidatus Undinarchaeales archaeon]|nr:ferritin [Candidatus Undinarchaeales archaeon]
MLSERMQEALNKQVNAELYSSYLYLSMAAYFSAKNLPGFASWMTCQVQEEIVHAMKIHQHVLGRGGGATLLPIEGPPLDWESPRAVFEATYAHEQKVTGLINGLVDLAQEEKDHATVNFLQWFVAEQVEEEESASGALEKVKLAGDGAGLFMLDQELAQRIFTIPPVPSE